MPSREVEETSIHPPIEEATADRIRARTASRTPAGKAILFEGFVSRRLELLAQEEARFAALREKEELRIAALRDKAYALEEEAQLKKAAMLTEARVEAERIIKAAEEQAAKMLNASESQASSMRALALPPPPRPGGGEIFADVFKQLATVGLEKGFGYLTRAIELNPEAAGEVSRTAARVVQSFTGEPEEAGPAPAAVPPPPPPPPASPPPPRDPHPEPSRAAHVVVTMEEFNRAATSISKETQRELCERFHITDMADISTEFMAAVVLAYREAQAHHGG